MVIGQPESTQTALSSNNLGQDTTLLLRHPTPLHPHATQSTRQQTKHQVGTESQTTHALTALIMLMLAFVLAYIPDLKHTHRWSNNVFIAIALCGYGQHHAQVWQAHSRLHSSVWGWYFGVSYVKDGTPLAVNVRDIVMIGFSQPWL